MNVKIRTRKGNKMVETRYSDDRWNNPGWQTCLIVIHHIEGFAMEEIRSLDVGKDWKQAGSNHLEMCKEL